MANALFIVGYYRSGTSALAGALARLGVKFYNEADPNEHNPLGFYEIPELIQFDVALFNHLGVDWTDLRGLPEGWADRTDIAPFLSGLDAILRRRFTAPATPLWGLKHPHLCRTLPLYERAARQSGHAPHVVHIFRDPWATAASQQHKNGLTRAHALLLWLSYATSAERQARHLPRSWLTYDALLSDPQAAFRRIEQDTGLALSHAPARLRHAAAHLSGTLNRSEPTAATGLHRPLYALVTDCWDAIQARDFRPECWEDLAAQTQDMVSLLSEIAASRARAIPAFGGAPPSAPPAPAPALRPPERLDAAARRLLEAAAPATLPRLGILLIAPPGRAAAITDTLASLHAQWRPADTIRIVAADPITLPDHEIIHTGHASGGPTRTLCAELTALAASTDYAAILNAGDRLEPDACLRFALAAAQSEPDLIYCDEIVPREGGAWVRHKPGWDITRLRQSAYLGDWVWYRAATLRALGGFNPARAGAEEYDFQLRLAETSPTIVRLPEALFQRSPHSLRDAIPAADFCARAADAITDHLARMGMPAQVQHRQHPGLFHQLRTMPDPGTSIILLCDGADIPAMDGWMTRLLSGAERSGPIILAGEALSAPTARYLTAVAQQADALGGKVLAIPPAPDAALGSALAQAIARIVTPHVAIIDARSEPTTPHWLEELRTRLADPGIAFAAARALTPLGTDPGQSIVHGPIILGADTRLGAGHLADDPGPGGWLMVDQEASALAPPLLARSAALKTCTIAPLPGDARWIDVCAQLRAAGARLAWTPDISFIAPPASITPDADCRFREGGPAARDLPWADPFHHPALSLHGNLLAAEQRPGLVPAAPAHAHSLLITHTPEATCLPNPVLSAARTLREAGKLAVGFAPETPSAAELGRLAPSLWLRINPTHAPGPHHAPYRAIFTAAPPPAAQAAIAAATQCFATSPALVSAVGRLAPPGALVMLWRPTLDPTLWTGLAPATGLNTRPRILWIDEGIAPAWLPQLIEQTQESATWIAISANDKAPAGAAHLAPPPDAPGFAQMLAECAPHLLVRPASRADTDHSVALMAAAAGCHLLADERLDLPASLGALRLPNRPAAWRNALLGALQSLTATLAQGKRARAAALAWSAAAPPPCWADTAPTLLQSAAE